MKRRNFIKLSLLTASMILIPNESFGSLKDKNQKTLVLVELDGGNDGLNTVVPYTEKNYYKLRPSLGLKKDELNILDKEFAFNKNLENITKLFKNNDCAVVHGLGYSKPNLSHFRSIEIVETASNTNEYLDEGWIARELKKYSLDEKRPASAMLIGKRKKGHLFSKDLNILQVKNINNFIKKSSKINRSSEKLGLNSSLDFLHVQEESIKRANRALTKHAKNINIETSFSNSEISKDFKEALKVIKSPLDIPLIKISQKGYDTHSNQKQRQSELLKELDEAIGSFVLELKKENLFDDILIMTYSEFGRRVKENASNGTDHGTASSQFVIGGQVKGGFYGKSPNLNTLSRNNLVYTTHYRALYNTILSKWFGNKNNRFNRYEILNFL